MDWGLIFIQIRRPQAPNFTVSQCANADREQQTRKSSLWETRKPYQTKGQTPFTLLNVSTFLFTIMFCQKNYAIIILLHEVSAEYSVRVCICVDEQVWGLEATEFPNTISKISSKCGGKSFDKGADFALFFCTFSVMMGVERCLNLCCH